jgi:hypothetical protein
MELTTEQRKTVKQWVEEGATLSQIQTRIKTEFGVSLTFLATRMLVGDLGAQLKDKPEPKKPAPEADESLPEDEEAGAMDAGDMEPAPAPGEIAGKVAVTLDRVVRAGAMVSGDVTFSDGTKCKWLLDQMGRLGLDGAKPGYRPPSQDIQEFQIQLRQLLQARGY